MRKRWLQKTLVLTLTAALITGMGAPAAVQANVQTELQSNEAESDLATEELSDLMPQEETGGNVQQEEVQLDTTETSNEIQKTGTGYVPIEEDTSLYEVENTISTYAMESKYDPRTHGGVISPVLDQGKLGICWAISALSAGELGLMQKGVMDTNDSFSKLHLAYSAFHGEDETFLSSNWKTKGGNRRVSVATLSRWYGAEEESKVPFSIGFESDADQKLSQIVDLDASVSHLKNSMWYPEIVRDGETRLNQLDWIKKGIKEYGAVEISFRSSDQYDRATNSFYHEKALTQDHAVIIVGWDDEKVTKAPEPGALLCKNSWGDSWGDNGYFWISYYDKTLQSPASYEFEDTASGEHEYSINNQYDGAGYGGYLSGTYTKEDGYDSNRSGANVFTAQQAQEIGAVSFYAPASSTSFNIKIHTGVKDAPNSGEHVRTITGDCTFAGFYTVDIDPVYVKKGEKFAVELMIASQKYTNGSKNVYLPVELSYSGEVAAQTAPVEKGQSYLRTRYGWTDIKKAASEPYNFCIKALSNPAENRYTVTFKSMGKPYKTVEVTEGDTVKPYKPKAVKNYVFYGWCKDSACKNAFDFDKKIKKDTNIYTRWGQWKSLKKSGKTYWRYYPNIKENKYVKSQFLEIDGEMYRFNSSGYMFTGWYQTSSGNYYYLGSDGAMDYGWHKIGGKYYYLKKSSGKMLTGWQTISGKKYYLGKDGARRTGKHKIDGKWYTFDKNGVLK